MSDTEPLYDGPPVSWAMTVAGRLATTQFEQAAAGLTRRYSSTQWIPLFVLRYRQEDTVRRLAATCGLRETTANAVLDKLERDGCVTRRRDPEDHRRVIVSITPAGVEAVDEASPVVRKALAQARAVLSPAEQETLFALLSKFIAANSPDVILIDEGALRAKGVRPTT